MQDCFRLHPDVYGAELEDDEDEDETEITIEAVRPDESAPAEATPAEPAASKSTPSVSEAVTEAAAEKTQAAKDAAHEIKTKVEPVSESEDLLPKAAHDARERSSKAE
jgi:mitochondrial intermembrane space import and assembly protein 40